MKFDKDTVCTLCGRNGAKVLKGITGNLQYFLCEACIKLSLDAKKEQEQHGILMNRWIPETFWKKPACSLMWLMTYFTINEGKYKIH